jgi:hypothetical protein
MIDLEIIKNDSIHCPVIGWMISHKCESLGEYHLGCPFYKGIKIRTDTNTGERYQVVVCGAKRK